MSGMNPTLGTGFMISTLLISVPSAIKTFNWMGTMWGGTLRFHVPMLHAIAFVAMFVIGLVLPLIGFSMIEAGSPASNVTRAYLSTAAISAGLDSFWGQVFGQVTFHVVRQASSLIGYSWELTEFYYGTRYGVLPPLYSWYARSFGEFGITGYVLVGLGFSLVARRLFAIGHRTEGATARALLFLGAMFLFQFLAMALSIESLRVPQFWFAWIFIALLFFHLKPSGRTNG
jgi:hypothetical protein